MSKKIVRTGKNPKKAKKQKQNNRCPFCGAPIQMVPFSEMGFRFVADKHPDFYWRCSNYPKCDAYVAANNQTKKPAGTLANTAMRYKRIVIHKWGILLVSNKVFSRRGDFAAACANILGYPRVNDIHISRMSNYELDTLRAYFKNMYEKNDKVKQLVDAEVSSVLWKEVRGLNESVNRNVYDADGKLIMDKYEEEAMAMMAEEQMTAPEDPESPVEDPNGPVEEAGMPDEDGGEAEGADAD